MEWFNNLKIARKFIIAFMIVSAVAAVVSFVCIRTLGAINDNAERTYQKELMSPSYIKEANIDDTSSRMLMFFIILGGIFLISRKMSKSIRKYKEAADKFTTVEMNVTIETHIKKELETYKVHQGHSRGPAQIGI